MYLTRLPYAFHFHLSFHLPRSTYDTAFLINAFTSFRHFYPEKGLMLRPYFIFVSRVDLSLTCVLPARFSAFYRTHLGLTHYLNP